MTVIAAGLLAYAISSRQTAPEPRPAAASTPMATIRPLPEQAALPAAGSTSRGLASEAALPGSFAERWAGGFTSDDPYPIIMALRNRRGPGSFGAARDIILACLPGMLASEHDGQLMQAATRQTNYAARLQARQTFVSRCHRVTHVSGDHLERLEDDEHGRRFIDAVVSLQHRSTETREAWEAALREIAGQGQLVSAAPRLKSLTNWKGESWQGAEDRADFSAAVELAALRASATPGTERSDLRLIERCYRWGDCEYRYDAALDTLPAPRRDRVRQLAAEMEAAFRSNDLRPFLGPTR
ncbi:hypothetical protein J7U46_15375 [Pelomonas sp. V22]|uniref:hypothetical protein n=1 Tax=Pelomonas sp. V22 TaxID=2822139 RepID=UPI0024A92BAD|nr:hypothetical protein [Pelomonas sp. V22]MDI4634439.1 hypothetical protein [Pelomonas sp. V22]